MTLLAQGVRFSTASHMATALEHEALRMGPEVTASQLSRFLATLSDDDAVMAPPQDATEEMLSPPEHMPLPDSLIDPASLPTIPMPPKKQKR